MHQADRIHRRSLYRRSLKLALDWAVSRQLWRGQALYIRHLFEANRHVTDQGQQRVYGADLDHFIGAIGADDTAAQALLRETEKLLETWKHPEPYVPPTAPGGSFLASPRSRPTTNAQAVGSKYERNLPAPILDRGFPNPTPMATLSLVVLTNYSSTTETPTWSASLIVVEGEMERIGTDVYIDDDCIYSIGRHLRLWLHGKLLLLTMPNPLCRFGPAISRTCLACNLRLQITKLQRMGWSLPPKRVLTTTRMQQHASEGILIRDHSRGIIVQPKREINRKTLTV